MQILLIRHGESKADILNVHEGKLIFPPMDMVPKSFTLKPSHTNNEGFSEEIKELELVVPLDKKR
ncbi:hypothetical protein MKY46_03110 [Lysinibacillus sp. FSL M8-0355]|uniref:hypothetical protein n=1 Tax=Lysinibacillus sp. FSL M8-0355 TaxID=2921719 RepID=UPI0030F5DA83